MVKQLGWFSRRNRTDEAHRGAQATRQAGLDLKKQRADDQAARTAKRTPEEIQAQRDRKEAQCKNRRSNSNVR